MHPVLINWRGIRIHSYSVMLYLASLCTLLVIVDYAGQTDMSVRRVALTALLLTVVGLVGARMLHIFIHLDDYRCKPYRIWQRSAGGAAMLGGLILMLAVSVPLLKIMQLPWWRFWDVATPGLLLGLAIAKIGCLLHGCCAGRVSNASIAINLPDHDGVWKPRIPSQLLESSVALLLFVVSMLLWYTYPKVGTVFLVCLMLYALSRSGLQLTREVQDRIGVVNAQVFISMILVMSALAGLLLRI